MSMLPGRPHHRIVVRLHAALGRGFEAWLRAQVQAHEVLLYLGRTSVTSLELGLAANGRPGGLPAPLLRSVGCHPCVRELRWQLMPAGCRPATKEYAHEYLQDLV